MPDSATESQKSVGDSSEPCPLRKCTILVQVQRQDTKGFIGNATVKLEGPTPGSGQTSTGTGAKLFDPVKPGTYKGEVTLAGGQAEEFEKPRLPTFSLAPSEDKVVIVEVKRITAWIAIVLVDEANQPVANERYRLKLADGTIREGALGPSGRVRLDDIERGRCEVCFPNLDKDAWEPVAS